MVENYTHMRQSFFHHGNTNCNKLYELNHTAFIEDIVLEHTTFHCLKRNALLSSEYDYNPAISALANEAAMTSTLMLL